MNSVTANLDSTDNISVSPKSLQVTYNSIAHPGIFSILIIFVIPFMVIAGGFVVWFRTPDSACIRKNSLHKKVLLTN